MRTFVVITAIALTLAGCSSPTAPTPKTSTSIPQYQIPGQNPWLWAMAVDSSGKCIEGATFEVISGQGPIGTVITQQTPCDIWDLGGGVEFKNLEPSVAMTLRASAAGYTSTEKTALPKYAGTVDEFLLNAVSRVSGRAAATQSAPHCIGCLLPATSS